MSLFDQIYSGSAFPALRSFFGEPARYIFQSGGDKPITAIITRDTTQQFEVKGQFLNKAFLLQIAKTDIDQVDTGGDKIEIPLESGGTELATFSVLRVLSENARVVEVLIA